MGSALLVDGKQKSVSPIHLDYPIDGTSYIIDSSHKVVWFASISAPYGSELARLDYRDPAHLQAELVKDINPGSSSALPSNYSNNLGALLDNGKLLFLPMTACTALSLGSAMARPRGFHVERL